MVAGGITPKWLLAIAAAMTLSNLTACSARTTYAGIDLAPGAADPKLQFLANRAQAGDKRAQLELGIRYEKGDGVPVDLERARSLYRSAATDTPIKQTVYVPEGGGVRPETTYAGVREGLPEAADRLMSLENEVLEGDARCESSPHNNSENGCLNIMTEKREFPTTTKAERAASTPGPRTISAVLEKVEFLTDYVHEPEVTGETDPNYFAVSFDYECGPPLEQVNQPRFGDRTAGANATRLLDAVPADPRHAHIMVFEDQVGKDDLSDLYGWSGDFWLISDRLRILIEEMDPGSIECVEAVGHNLTPDQPYWVCLSRRNLEAVDATRSDVRISHENLAADREDPIIFQSIMINRGALFDPEVTKGAHQFWDIDLQRWFWSRELIARAHHSGIRGAALSYAGRPIGGSVRYTELDKIYAEFSKN